MQTSRFPDFLARHRAKRKLEIWCHLKNPCLVLKLTTPGRFSRSPVWGWLCRLFQHFRNSYIVQNHWMNEARINIPLSRVKLAAVPPPTMGTLATNPIGF